jgi:protein O-GlcNAc transferase
MIFCPKKTMSMVGLERIIWVNYYEIGMPHANDRQKLHTAFSFHQRGNVKEAANLYRQLIESDPNNFQALQYLGVIEAGAGRIEHAKSLMARSLAIQPANIQFIENYASILCQGGDYATALQVCRDGLRINKANVSLLYVSAIASFKLGRLQDSLSQFDRLLLLQPNHLIALNERGFVLAEMKTYDAALASVKKAININPAYPEAQLNKAILYIANCIALTRRLRRMSGY